MPKLGMGPVRREQICRAAARVIASQGFAGTTMRMVAEEAEVSTGMLNHYFANRMAMLEETLVFVSTRQQSREASAIERLEPGEERLRALVRSVLPTDRETMEAWRVWIAAHGAAVRLVELRRVMTARNELWFEILELGLEGIVAGSGAGRLPFVWQLDAMMNGLVVQAITTEAEVSFDDIEDAVVAMALAHVPQPSGRAAERAPKARPRRAARSAAA
jgi:TetR/AcrR family transcriptional regulator, transcriptional repressor of bet genes